MFIIMGMCRDGRFLDEYEMTGRKRGYHPDSFVQVSSENLQDALDMLQYIKEECEERTIVTFYIMNTDENMKVEHIEQVDFR